LVFFCAHGDDTLLPWFFCLAVMGIPNTLSLAFFGFSWLLLKRIIPVFPPFWFLKRANQCFLRPFDVFPMFFCGDRRAPPLLNPLLSLLPPNKSVVPLVLSPCSVDWPAHWRWISGCFLLDRLVNPPWTLSVSASLKPGGTRASIFAFVHFINFWRVFFLKRFSGLFLVGFQDHTAT